MTAGYEVWYVCGNYSARLWGEFRGPDDYSWRRVDDGGPPHPVVFGSRKEAEDFIHYQRLKYHVVGDYEVREAVTDRRRGDA